MSRAKATLLVGLGSPHGDDAVGWRIAERIVLATVPGMRVRCAETPLDLLDWLDGMDHLVVCDACESNGVVGTVYDWRWPSDRMVARRVAGSHDVDLAGVLNLAERLGRLPDDVRVYAIAGRRFKPGDTLSPELESALPAIVDQIVGELRHARALAGKGAAQAS